MTRRGGDTERRPRLNPNAQNVFFMRAESIVIWSFLFVAGIRRVRADGVVGHVERREEERRGRGMDGLIIGKINDSSELIRGSSRQPLWEVDKVEDGCRERKRKRETEVHLKANLKILNPQFGNILVQCTLLAVEI